MSLRSSPSRLQVGVGLTHESLAGRAGLLDLGIEIRDHLGGHDFVLALALSDERSHAVADGNRDVAVRRSPRCDRPSVRGPG